MAVRLLEGFVRAGTEAFILTIDGNWELLRDVDGQLSPGMRRRFIRLSSADVRNSVWMKVAYAPWQWLRLTQQVRRLNLDVVVSFMERANIMTLLSPRVQKVISVRSHYKSLMASKAPLKRALVRCAYSHLLRRAGGIVLNSAEAVPGLTNVTHR